MSRRLSGALTLAVLTLSLTAFAKDDPPPPPPPPPPIEETGPVESSSSGGEGWAIKGNNGLLDRSTGHVRKMMLSFFLGVPFSYSGYGLYVSSFSVGLGVRFYIPIVKEGFLPMLNDSFGIEFGADPSIVFGGFGYNTGFGIAIPVEARWNFHLFPRLEVYAKLGAGIGVLVVSPSVYVGFVPVANVGVLFKLNETLFLRAELGYPAVKVGLGIAF